MIAQSNPALTVLEIRNIALSNIKNKLAPLWSLENFVAVNPYMGMTDQSFLYTSQILKTLQDSSTTFSKGFYLEELKSNKIQPQHLSKAFELIVGHKPENIQEVLNEVTSHNFQEKKSALELFVDMYSNHEVKEWDVFMQDRITSWAAAYFDKGQAKWNTAKIENSIFKSWKTDASFDKTPEIMGLKNFRSFVKSLSENKKDVINFCLDTLPVSDTDTEKYLHALALKFKGWGSYIAGLDWDNNLISNDTNYLEDFIAVLLAWETYFYKILSNQSLNLKWKFELCNESIENQILNTEIGQKVLLQTAYDIANQENIIQKINHKNNSNNPNKSNKIAQALFCIDVRSEVYRRNLEETSPDIETKGYAGFFGFPIKYQLKGFDKYEKNSPVLLEPQFTVNECFNNTNIDKNVAKYRQVRYFINKSIKGFKGSSISCFSYVSPIGLFYLPKLAMDSFGLSKPAVHPQNFWFSNNVIKKRDLSFDGNNGIPFENQKAMAAGMLKAAGLNKDFAPYVLIVGHGSSSVNNPYASGLDCGACGGHSGEANAKLAAKILNDQKNRNALVSEGISIPENTVFVGCLHNTTTDEIEIFKEHIELKDKALFETIISNIKLASEKTRKERSARLLLEKAYSSKSVLNRANDWAQVRPEWGLAGCNAFIIANRDKVKHANFNGKSFLHEYNYLEDKEASILESIMCAPMVVTSMINLQYYASTVDNTNYGAGNKLLHNIVGGFGVIEGHGGDLKTGLPIQSVHDGINFQHLPNRLNVFIDAPISTINSILSKHNNLKNLFDNQWLFLFAFSEHSKVAYRYTKNLQWETLDKSKEISAPVFEFQNHLEYQN